MCSYNRKCDKCGGYTDKLYTLPNGLSYCIGCYGIEEEITGACSHVKCRDEGKLYKFEVLDLELLLCDIHLKRVELANDWFKDYQLRQETMNGFR